MDRFTKLKDADMKEDNRFAKACGIGREFPTNRFG